MASITEEPRPAARGADRAVSAAMATVMASEVLWLATRWPLFEFTVDAGLIAVVALSAPRFGLREVYLLTLCAALAGAVLATHDAPWAVLAGALDQAAFLMAFILLIGLVQQAASSSGAIRDCGLFLTRQPSGRRYLALFLGTHLMAQIFNLGAISLLTPLVKSGSAANAEDALQPIRERRQLNALLRGFAWCVIWSPTAVAPLVVMTLLPAADRALWIGAGVAIAMVVMLVGWAEDRWAWRSVRRRLAQGAPSAAPPFPARAFGDFGLVCLALLGLTLGAMALAEGTVVFGLMAASPLVLLGWLLGQNGVAAGRASAALRATGVRLSEIYRGYLPRSAPLAVTLACSGFVGRAAAALIPAADWAEAAGLADLPGWVFCVGLSVGVAILSQFALSPIMMAVFFGSLIADIPVLPVDVTWAALAISCGWALSMTISPFATVVLMMEQITDHPGRELTWHWNWRYSLLCVLVLAAAFWLLTGGR